MKKKILSFFFHKIAFVSCKVSLKLLPEGFILWYHSHVNPQVASLAEPAQRDNLLLPHAKAFVSNVMPEGLLLDIDRNAVAAELLSFPDLERPVQQQPFLSA